MKNHIEFLSVQLLVYTAILFPVQTTSVKWLFSAGLLNPALLGARLHCASGQKRYNTAIQLASVVVLKFVLFSVGTVKYWRVRNVYFHGFEPREGYESTGLG